jgi:hypothetical protein
MDRLLSLFVLFLLVSVIVKVWQIAAYLHLPCTSFYWGCI